LTFVKIIVLICFYFLISIPVLTETEPQEFYVPKTEPQEVTIISQYALGMEPQKAIIMSAEDALRHASRMNLDSESLSFFERHAGTKIAVLSFNVSEESDVE